MEIDEKRLSKLETEVSRLSRGRPTSFSVGVIGVGNLGKHVVRALQDIKKEGILGLDKILVSDIDYIPQKDKTYKEDKDTVVLQFKSRLLSSFSDNPIDPSIIDVVRYTEEGIQEMKERTDIIFVNSGIEFKKNDLDKSPKYTNQLNLYMNLQRIGGLESTDYRILDGLPVNLGIITDLAKWIAQGGYNGHVAISTNPTDILTYVFKLYSGLGNQVSGFNHMETIRFQRHVLSYLQNIGESDEENKNFALWNNGIVIGDHGGGAVPVFSHLKFPPKFSFGSLKAECYSDVMSSLRLYITKIGEKNEEHKKELEPLDKRLTDREKEFSMPGANKAEIIMEVARDFLRSYAPIAKYLCNNDAGMIREETSIAFREVVEQIVNGDYLIASSLCGKLTDFIREENRDAEIERIIETHPRELCMGYFAGYSWFDGHAPRVQGITKSLSPWEARYFAQRYAIISRILNALREMKDKQGQNIIIDDNVPSDIIDERDIKEGRSNAPIEFKKLYEGPTQGKQKPIVIQINGTPIRILQKLAGLDEIPSELKIESYTRTTKDNSERIAKFDSLYEKVEQMLYDVPTSYFITNIDHITKLAQAAKDLLNYVVKEGYVDEIQRDRMKTLDAKLNELKVRDATEIRKRLFKGEAWDKILQELNDDRELMQEWIDYTKKWLNTKFASPERKKLEANLKYQRAVALQRKYHPLLGQSRANIENNFGCTEETQKALELYKQVCGIWC